MNKFSPEGTVNDCWDEYSKNYNLLADCLMEHNIDIQLLRKTINSHEKYQRQLMKNKIITLLKGC
jgi:hypothetical protein